MQWVATGYLLALALMVPLCGWLVDAVGSKRVYVGAFILYTLSSTLCGSGDLDRAIDRRSGVSGHGGRSARSHGADDAGAVRRPSDGAHDGDHHLSDPDGADFGPSIAGVILHVASWHWLFLLNLPLGVIAIVLAIALLPADARTQPRRLDWLGCLLVSPGLVLLLDGMHRFATTEPSSRYIPIAETAASLCLLTAFAVRGWRLADKGLIDLRLFQRHNFNASALTQFLAMSLTQGGMMLFPLYLLTLRELSASTVGLIIPAMGLARFPPGSI